MQSSVGGTGRSADDRLDAVFHALGDRTRRALLARLADFEREIDRQPVSGIERDSGVDGFLEAGHFGRD